ncbi:Serine phosphatase RsbU, regulator of sigma subunit [Blastococcus aurantiacus]|uniref:Serine phosphatase RsbU, regulator of sigma subunit n=1 Tax=Blastococcus aurantiacus TaxID=1550231 RepID=A0A1G7HLQ3_9ACTN|nr:SpoIIE family protein phosphatase [Blastococcus aurantiacus]SDF01204.1 Serine phosphatase RsbU, regulator of sigma subunit [Blastococcus aurantiacus]
MSRWWRTDGVDDGVDDADAQTLESMPIGLLELDTDWTVRYINAAGEQMVGHVRADLLGRSYWDAFPASTGNDFGRAYREAVATRRPQTFEAFYPEPLNQWYEVHAVPALHGLWVYFTEVTARRQAVERLALLARVSEDLVGTLNAPAAVGRIPRVIVPALANWATVAVLAEDGTLLDAGAWHVDPAKVPLVRRFAAAAQASFPTTSPSLRAVTTGTPVTVPATGLTGRALGLVATGEARRLLRVLDPGTMTVLPIRGPDRVLGVLTLVHDRHRAVDPADLATATEVAQRAGLALDNARLYEQQRRLAEELQRSMLTAAPQPDHAQIVVRYLPAGEAARVGGDWYDAFVQPDGATVLVIGDVVGHDTSAAASMGQLRSMLRGIAVTGDVGPAGLLAQLDAAMTQLQLHTYATAALARFEQSPEDLERGITRMRFANAGHPPPLIIHPDGTIAELASWRGDLMLGVDSDTRRSESVVSLDRRTTVLLYTDGLIERRDSVLDDGMDRLRAAAAEFAGLPLDELCDRLIERLVDSRPEDDVALVAIRLHRQDRPRPDVAGPRDVPPTVPPDPAG